MSRLNRPRLVYMWRIARKGPTELGYAYFRARRRSRNRADDEVLDPDDLIALSGAYDIADRDLEGNARVLEAYEAADALDIRSVQWFLPFFRHAYFGGVYTILRFADRFARVHGVENRFHIYDAPAYVADEIARKIAAAWPALAGSEVTAGHPPAPEPDAGSPGEPSHVGPTAHLRECDAAIATLWTSAYPLLGFQRTRAKFFFLQDFEPQFYPAGSAYALTEQTYLFGFPGVVNTPGLADVYRSYGNKAISFVPAVDTARYHPPAAPRPETPVRIFFYARPSTPRNAFGLGLAALAKVKEWYGDRVEIICAGEPWNPGQFGVAGRVTNLGLLPSLDDVADLYRTCHIGLVFMLTKHPSYQPFEFMASGMACVSNVNPHTAWFLRDGENCLLAPPAPTQVAERLAALVEDPELRRRLADRAIEDVTAVAWDDQIERVWGAMTKRGEPFSDAPETPTALPRSAAPRG